MLRPCLLRPGAPALSAAVAQRSSVRAVGGAARSLLPRRAAACPPLSAKRDGGMDPDAKVARKAAKAAAKAAAKRDKAARSMADDEDDDEHVSPLESVTPTARATGGARAVHHPQTIVVTDEQATAAASAALAAREAALWDRADALWAREMARWDEERAAWAAREAALLAALAASQAEVGRLAGVVVAAEGQPAALPQPQPAQAAAVAPAAAAAPAAVRAAPAVAAPPSPSPSSTTATTTSPSFADHLAAAVAAAAGGADVLADEFGGHGGLLGGRAAASEPAAPATPTAASPPPPPPPPPPPSPPSPAPLAAEHVPSVKPPTLVEGADDLFWVNALQTALVAAAFHCGDDEAEDFFFGPGTRNALLTFQACAGLPETGVCDGATWTALLGEDGLAALRPPTPEEEAAADDALSAAVGVGKATPPPPPPPPPPPVLPPKGSAGPVVETWTSTTTTTTIADVEDAAHHHHTVVRVEEESVSGSAVMAPAAKTAAPPRTAWPILREGDGGRPVHELHVALNAAGFYCGEDDEQWWQFGDSTHSALVTFQACSSLPESGVADERTWLALLGPGATPADGAALSAGDTTDDDMLGAHHEGMVFLVGEQRWERRISTTETDT